MSRFSAVTRWITSVAKFIRSTVLIE